MLEQRVNAGRAKVDPLRRVLHVIVHRVQLGERAVSREFRHVLSHNYIYKPTEHTTTHGASSP